VLTRQKIKNSRASDRTLHRTCYETIFVEASYRSSRPFITPKRCVETAGVKIVD